MSQEQLNELQYLDCSITETLRLCSGSLIMRHVQEPCEITLASGVCCVPCHAVYMRSVYVCWLLMF